MSLKVTDGKRLSPWNLLIRPRSFDTYEYRFHVIGSSSRLDQTIILALGLSKSSWETLDSPIVTVVC